MGRTAKTRGVSMTPELAARWDRLQGTRRTSDFVRYLVELGERDLRQREQQAALEELNRFQAELPPEWKDEAYYDLDSPDDFGSIPEAFTMATVDMREVLASWREADQP